MPGRGPGSIGSSDRLQVGYSRGNPRAGSRVRGFFCMTQPRFLRKRHPRLVLVASALVMVATVRTWAQPVALGGELVELPYLAASGRFDRILSLLKSGQPADPNPRVAALIQDLELYEKHRSEHTSQRVDAYKASLEEMVEHMGDGQLEQALAAAIDAHGLAPDPAAMLGDPQTVELVKQAEVAAQAAESQDDWVQALTLYRALDLLFDDLASYRQHVKRAGHHLRVLRLYTPQRLNQLYASRASRLGKEAPQLPPDQDDWRQQLKGIKLSMLRQTLAQAARRHVDSQGYAGLLSGGLDSLIIMTQTKGLEDAFESFADPAKVSQFHHSLVEMRQDLDDQKRPLNFLDAATLIDQVMEVNDKSVNLPEQVLIYELTQGATDTLDDFSTVIWPSDKEAFSRNTQGKFYGVGIQISIRDDQLIVVSPLEGTPAQRAGIKAGDIIATVDQRDASNWTLDRAVREITGPEGTPVKLGIQRAGQSDLLHFTLIRAEIVIESIRGWQRKPTGGWDYFIDPDLGIGYVRLSQFIPQSASDLDRAINLMQESAPLNAIILDLRFNPGGLLSASIEVTDRFVAGGPIVSTVGPDGKRTSQFRARGDHTHDQLPLVVLINEGSASASEIVSGALQDYQRATVIGTRSFGKGSVQDLFPLSGERAYLKLTTQYYQLPGGRIIHRKPDSEKWGIDPDLIVEMSPKQIADAAEFRQKVDVLRTDQDDDPENADEAPPKADQILENALDPQLEAALLVLKTRLLANQLVMARGG